MIALLLLLVLLGAAYPIVLYPALVLALARLRPKSWAVGPYVGEATHIITVHNEESRIRAKLDNALALESPGCRIDTLVASDGSSDRTEQIVREYAGRGVRWLACARRGKEHAQIDAVRLTSASVLVFSDASTLVDPDALPRLLEPFADPRVLAVSGTDVPAEGAGRGTGEDLYVRFEMAVREAESLVDTIVGLSGCFFAVRREIALQFLPDVPSDFSGALLAIASGGRAVAAQGARARYASVPSMGAEFARKRRTALRGIRCLWVHRRVLAAGDRLAAWQVLSHKVWRFTMPFWLLGAALLLLVGAWGRGFLLGIAALAMIVLLLLATVGLLAPALRRFRLVRAPAFALASAAAVVFAWKDFFVGRSSVRWTPTTRPGAP